MSRRTARALLAPRAACAALALLLGACDPGSGPEHSEPAQNLVDPLDASFVPPDVPTAGLEPAVAEQLLGARDAFLRDAPALRKDPSALGDRLGSLATLDLAYDLSWPALVLFDLAERTDPEDARWPHGLAHALLARDDPGSAAMAFLRAQRLAPESAAAHLRVAEAFEMHGWLDQAETSVQAALDLDPAFAAAHAARGRLAAARGEARAAAESFARALQLEPSARTLHYPLAMALRDLGETEHARAELQLHGPGEPDPRDPLLDALSALTTGARRHLLSGNVAFVEGRLDDARVEFEAALAADPDSAEAHMDLGAVLFHAGDDAGARAHYEAAELLDARHPQVQFGLGRIAARAGEHDEALRRYELALSVDPGFLDARFNLANTLRRLDRFDEAEAHYAEVVRRDPRQATARYARVLCLLREARWDDARTVLDDGLAVLPDEPRLGNALARLLASCPEDALRDGARALQMSEALLARERSLSNVEALAMSLAELGRFEEAVSWQRAALDAARSAAPDDVPPRLAQNLALYEDGRPCRAPWPADDPLLSPGRAPAASPAR